MLQTDKSWECFDALGAIFNQPGLRTYRCVEVALNIPLFHLDLIFDCADEIGDVWSRHIYSQLADVLDVIRRSDVKRMLLSIQTPRLDDGYRFFSVQQIILAKNSSGDSFYFYVGENQEYNDAFSSLQVSDLLEKEILWEAKN